MNMQLPTSSNQTADYDDEEDDDTSSVSLVEALTWLGEGKRLIAGAGFLAAVAAIGATLLMAPVYTASTTFLPPTNAQQQGGSAAALAALGSLSGLGSVGGKTPDEMYVGLLSSDSVLRGLDQRFDLKDRYKSDSHETLRRQVGGLIRISSDKKSGFISVEVDDKDPEFAAKLANAHAEEVSKVLGRLAVSEAQQRRMFYEQQLKDTKEQVVKAETALRAFQEKSGVLALEKQAEFALSGAAQLRAQIAEREVQMKVLRLEATAQNPAALRLASEIQALRSELAAAETTSATKPGADAGTGGVSIAKLPGAAVEYLRARRELKLQEALLEGMIRQYELAKLDEAKEGPSLQQVDKAMPPDRKSKPKRASIVIVVTMLALFLSSSVVLGRRYVRKVRGSNPLQAQSWANLAGAWKWRS